MFEWQSSPVQMSIFFSRGTEIKGEYIKIIGQAGRLL
jgi:hypothetical protein